MLPGVVSFLDASSTTYGTRKVYNRNIKIICPKKQLKMVSATHSKILVKNDSNRTTFKNGLICLLDSEKD